MNIPGHQTANASKSNTDAILPRGKMIVVRHSRARGRLKTRRRLKRRFDVELANDLWPCILIALRGYAAVRRTDDGGFPNVERTEMDEFLFAAGKR